MPPVDMHFGVPPERVFEVLSDPATYADWVVGSRSVERWDPEWPKAGAKFAHTQGKWPVIINDETVVEASEPPHHLQLLAKARPMLVARVILDMQPEAGGTRVTMEERAVSGVAAAIMKIPPNNALTRLRNTESLRRLKRIAENGDVRT
jgi:uncharacterized protein YndB with AHSA1/START domain